MGGPAGGIPGPGLPARGKLFIKTHGCQMNEYDSSKMADVLADSDGLELTDNPDSYMLLMDSGPDGIPDPATEIRVPLHRGSCFLVDTQRLWHVVVHNGTEPRYALISSFESGPILESWVAANRP